MRELSGASHPESVATGADEQSATASEGRRNTRSNTEQHGGVRRSTEEYGGVRTRTTGWLPESKYLVLHCYDQDDRGTDCQATRLPSLSPPSPSSLSSSLLSAELATVPAHFAAVLTLPTLPPCLLSCHGGGNK